MIELFQDSQTVPPGSRKQRDMGLSVYGYILQSGISDKCRLPEPNHNGTNKHTDLGLPWPLEDACLVTKDTQARPLDVSLICSCGSVGHGTRSLCPKKHLFG